MQASTTRPDTISIRLAAAHTQQSLEPVGPTRQPAWDCTPTATLSALRFVGAGANGKLPNDTTAAVAALRSMALGDDPNASDPLYGVYPAELAPVVARLGATARVTSSLADIFAAVDGGSPAIVSGNAALLQPTSASEAAGYAPHSIMIAARDAREGAWLVSDPARPVANSIAESALRAFLSAVPPGYASPQPGASAYEALVVGPAAGQT
jgi:hypothetical protein